MYHQFTRYSCHDTLHTHAILPLPTESLFVVSHAHTHSTPQPAATDNTLFGTIPCIPPYCTYKCDTTALLTEQQLNELNAELLQYVPQPKHCTLNGRYGYTGTYPLYPMVFGTYADNLHSCVGVKYFDMATVIAGNQSTYIYDKTVADEYAYARHYRLSRYAHTMLKHGWDCNRHYEILAALSVYCLASLCICMCGRDGNRDTFSLSL